MVRRLLVILAIVGGFVMIWPRVSGVVTHRPDVVGRGTALSLAQLGARGTVPTGVIVESDQLVLRVRRVGGDVPFARKMASVLTRFRVRRLGDKALVDCWTSDDRLQSFALPASDAGFRM